MNMPTIKGYSTEPAIAWWIWCETCNDSELVYGATADDDALTWATEHHEQFGHPARV